MLRAVNFRKLDVYQAAVRSRRSLQDCGQSAAALCIFWETSFAEPQSISQYPASTVAPLPTRSPEGARAALRYRAIRADPKLQLLEGRQVACRGNGRRKPYRCCGPSGWVKEFERLPGGRLGRHTQGQQKADCHATPMQGPSMPRKHVKSAEVVDSLFR